MLRSFEFPPLHRSLISIFSLKIAERNVDFYKKNHKVCQGPSALPSVSLYVLALTGSYVALTGCIAAEFAKFGLDTAENEPCKVP